MTRKVTVTFDDGESIMFDGVPENATPEQVAGRARNQFGKAVTSVQRHERTPWETVKREVSRVGADVVKGVASLPALLADIRAPFGAVDAAIASAVIPGAPVPDIKEVINTPITFDLTKAVQSIGPQAETKREKIQSAVTQGAAGSILNPFGGISKAAIERPVVTAIAGGSAGAGAELASWAHDSPLTRIVGGVAGGLAGGGAAGWVSKARPQTANLAKEAMEGITEESIDKAREFQALAQSKGVKVDIAQALEAVGAPHSNVTTLRNVLANSMHGDKVKGTLRQQPLQLERLADRVEASLPGPVVGKATAVNQVAKAASDRLRLDERLRSAAVESRYARAGTLTAQQVQELADVVLERATRAGSSENLRGTAAGLNQRLQELIGDGTHQIQALDVDRAIGDAMGRFKGAVNHGANPYGSEQVRALGKLANDRFQAMSSGVREAERSFANLSNSMVNPARQGVVGRVAGHSYQADKQSAGEALETLFKRGSDPSVYWTQREIPKLLSELKSTNPEAVPGAVREFVRSRMNAAFKSAPGETVKAPVGASESAALLYKSLFESRAQMQGMRDMVAGSARSMGLTAKETADAVRGVESFAQITKALRNTTTTEGVNWKDIAKLGGRSHLADAARVFSLMPMNRVGERIEEAVLAKTFRQFDEVLTHPEGLRMLQELGKVPVMSGRAATILGTFGGTLPNITSENE